MVGVGAFAQAFIPLFKAHPLVDEIILCDLDADKLRQNADRHGVKHTSPSLDHLLAATDVDAVAIITQPWLHARQALQALEAGRHVYSAVPTGETVDEIAALVRTVERTGLVYMLGETSYYYPGVIYCRQRYAHGDFGRVIYAEAEYYHDFDHGLYDVHRWRGGERWLEIAGAPPMYYPTHSTSQVIAVTGAHMTHVSCLGVVDGADDGIGLFACSALAGADGPDWLVGNDNVTALFRTSDGGMARINEFRRVGHPGTVRMSMWGTEGSFEQNMAGAMWVTKDTQHLERLDALLACDGVPVRRSDERDGMSAVTSLDGTHLGASPLHPVERLPKEFVGLPNGHCGSHQFLVDDFVRACVGRTLPPNHVWAAARYALPGIIAHESAVRGGAVLEVPDFGAGPSAG